MPVQEGDPSSPSLGRELDPQRERRVASEQSGRD